MRQLWCCETEQSLMECNGPDCTVSVSHHPSTIDKHTTCFEQSGSVIYLGVLSSCYRTGLASGTGYQRERRMMSAQHSATADDPMPLFQYSHMHNVHICGEKFTAAPWAKFPHIVSVKMDPIWMPANTKGVKGGMCGECANRSYICTSIKNLNNIMSFLGTPWSAAFSASPPKWAGNGDRN
jgi:hypothetical protein